MLGKHNLNNYRPNLRNSISGFLLRANNFHDGEMITHHVTVQMECCFIRVQLSLGFIVKKKPSTVSCLWRFNPQV